MTGTPTLRESLSGFPVWQMFVICMVRLAEPIAFTSMFPYIYFMVRDFDIAKDENDISLYTGYLSAAFAFIQFLVCIQWSNFSDKVGRKPVLLCGLLGTALLVIIFGFLPNFYVALFSRSLMGALNGNVAVIRTSIAEIAVERRHQALAFSLLSLLWSLGGVIGPLIGGSKYLTRPKGTTLSVEVVGGLYDQFLDEFPYALSNIVIAIILVSAFVFCALFFEETHSQHKKRRDVPLEIGDWISHILFGYEIPIRYWHKGSGETEALLPTIQEEAEVANIDSAIDDIEDSNSIDSYEGEEGEEGEALLTRRTSNAMISRLSSNVSLHANEVSGFNSRTFTGPVIQTSIASLILSFHQIVFLEYLPVLLAGEFKKESLQFPLKMTGGLSWDSQAIGTLLSTTGVIGVLVAAFVFPYMDRHMKAVVGFRGSTAIFPFVYFVLPYLVYSLKEYNQDLPDWLNPLLTYIVTGLCQLACSIAFPQIFILLHRATLPKHRGLVNGAILSLGSLARCIAPLVWGWLISYFNSIEMGELSWWLLSFICILGTILAFIMREYDEDMKV